MITINEAKCDHCSLCTLLCPADLIAAGPAVKPNAETACLECGHCVAVCPTEAITLLGFENVETKPLSAKNAIERSKMMSLLKSRRSGRNYKHGPVSREDMEEIVEAASAAPSAHNNRKVKAYVCQDVEAIRKIRNRMQTLYKIMWNAVKLPGIPSLLKAFHLYDIVQYTFEELMLSTGGRDMLLYETENLLLFTIPRFNAMASGDAWLAAENAVIYAESINVSACFNGFFGIMANLDPVIRRLLGIPWNESLKVGLTMGYPKLKYSREAPRKTMPIRWSKVT